MLGALKRASIWSAGAVRADDEARNFKRVWLPMWLGFALWSGLNAILYGSRLLDRLYGPATDVLGGIYILVAALAFVAVAFPRLWSLGLVTTFLLIGMNAVYVAGIIVSPSAEQLAATEAPNWFIVTQLCAMTVILYFHVEILLTEWVGRRAADRRAQAVSPDE